jgi:PAS domain S-box-containing protein
MTDALLPHLDDPDAGADAGRAAHVAIIDAVQAGTGLARLGRGADPFAAAVRATHMPIAISDPRLPDNPIVFVNDSFCRLSGYAREEVIGRNCRFLQGPGTDPAAVARIRAAVEASQGIEIDLRNHRKDGTPFWNRLLIAPVRDHDGQVAYFCASQVDVTLERDRVTGLETENAALLAELGDRLRAQELSEASLRLATEAAEVGTWDLDLDVGVPGGMLTWSARTKAMFGLHPDEPSGIDDFYAGLHPDDRAATIAAFAAAIDPAQRLAYDVEYRTLGKHDGALRWVAAKGRGLFRDGAGGGRCTRALGTAIDITARKAAQVRQDMLWGLSAHLQTLTDAPAIVAAAATALGQHLKVHRVGWGLVQPDGETTVMQTAYHDGLPPLQGEYSLEKFGAAHKARQRTGVTMVIHDCTAPHENREYWAALGIGAVVSVPLVRAGRVRASLFVNHRTPRTWRSDETGLVGDVAALIWDAMERARAEAELRELNATLEARVEQRTAELQRAEEALRQSQKMEAVGQLTGGIAHDFNNLLTGITGALELLARRVAAGRFAEVPRFVEIAATSANRAAALTQRLLAFARRQPLDPRPVDANALVAGMADLLSRTLGPGIPLDLDLAPGLWGTLCDPNQLENALLNLAINARDAMPGGGRLLIRTSNVAPGDAELDMEVKAWLQGAAPLSGGIAVDVTDTGTGMAPDVLERVFEPFFTTKPLGQGTGLGLSMLYGFIRQSGGQVRVLSAPGQGTTFRLLLPRHDAAAILADAPASTSPADAVAEGTVLVVDDEDAVRVLVAETLQELGYTVLQAADGPAGLGVLQSAAPVDLLVTDVGLPGLNGRQLADAARVLRPGLRVLFITGYAGGAVGHEALEPGMEILVKPFALHALVAKLRGMLAG